MKIISPPNTKLHAFLMKIANIGDSNIPNDDNKIYYSKIDGSYLGRVGSEESFEWLMKKGITEQIQDGYDEPKTSCIGFNPTEQKWFGWSHRAVFGFGIGSKIKQGDCGFKPSNKEEFIKRELNFWGDNEYAKEEAKAIKCNNGITITYVYNDKVPNKSLRGTKYEHFVKFPEKWGKGEWQARSLDDAKQMAIEFAKSVS